MINLLRDASGQNTYAKEFSLKKNKLSTTLAKGIAQSVTVPSEHATYIALIYPGNGVTVWVSNNENATIPGPSFSITNSEPNPMSRLVRAGDVLSFITNYDAAEVWIAFEPYSNYK